MKKEEKLKLEQQMRRKLLYLHLTSGVKELFINKWKFIFLIMYFLIVTAIWSNRFRIFYVNSTLPFYKLFQKGIDVFVPFILIIGLIFLISLIGTPFSSVTIHNNLLRIGFTNSVGEYPVLLSKYKNKKYPNIVTMEFDNVGISILEWEEKRLKIEAALNFHIVGIEYGKSIRQIVIHTVPAKKSLSAKLYWKDSYLSEESYVLILGESLLGRETVNLTKTPHILLGGSTGSGKSVLLKLLIMQCLKKNSIVYIADFKGGVDFSRKWHEKCNIVIQKNDLLDLLSSIVDILEDRKGILKEAGCSNVDEYNKTTEKKLQRIIFACDEVAEVLDKTGLSKDEKELILKIENKLSIIARQGRAFGIHLILATQRPDANILSGQIRNNMDCRICGRADNVLSQIILDNTDAADKIPKNTQGKFLTYNGVVFQGYLFDEGGF